MSAYMSLPKKGKGAGIVVLQEIFGVNESMRKVCDFLAMRQFTAICPDLFWRAEPGVELKESEADRGRALRGKMNDDQVTDDIASAMDFLRKHPACTGGVGVVGYCWGGMLAYLTAVRHKPDAAVIDVQPQQQNRPRDAKVEETPAAKEVGKPLELEDLDVDIPTFLRRQKQNG